MTFELRLLSAAPPPAVEALLDAAFGRDRHGRTAYRLRTGMVPIPALSASAWSGDVLAGVLQCWPIALTGDRGGTVPLVLVGPVAVAPAFQSSGIGSAMMRGLLAVADAEPGRHGVALTMIGDAPYYARFGFDAAATGGWRLPGPWDPARLLARTIPGCALPAAGMLGPR